jgi:hypothetical protein
MSSDEVKGSFTTFEAAPGEATSRNRPHLFDFAGALSPDDMNESFMSSDQPSRL